ncbi:MAG: hypothetical protein WCK49_03760 [Myxococcaceae bacterium]
MRNLIILCSMLGLLGACAGVRQAQTGIRQSINNSVDQQYKWGSVYCGEGTVCSEIEVLRVDFEDRNGGQVQVTLHNRTGLDLQAQISLQILNDEGAQLEQTNFQNVGIPASQEKVWTMPGIYQKGAKIRVVLRKL